MLSSLRSFLSILSSLFLLIFSVVISSISEISSGFFSSIFCSFGKFVSLFGSTEGISIIGFSFSSVFSSIFSSRFFSSFSSSTLLF
jgi:hypothetical protein